MDGIRLQIDEYLQRPTSVEVWPPAILTNTTQQGVEIPCLQRTVKSQLLLRMSYHQAVLP